MTHLAIIKPPGRSDNYLVKKKKKKGERRFSKEEEKGLEAIASLENTHRGSSNVDASPFSHPRLHREGGESKQAQDDKKRRRGPTS